MKHGDLTAVIVAAGAILIIAWSALTGVPIRAAAVSGHLRIDGTGFRTAGGRPFHWRGLTAFRLLDYVSEGSDARVSAYLAWARSKGITVVRVLAMGGGFMDLQPADGRRALSRLLTRAAGYGVHVEVVALAGTRDMAVDLDVHVGTIGRVLANHPNGLLEIANEPVHPTQAGAVQKPEVLLELSRRVPDSVPVSLGSVETGDGFAAGDYVTWHVPRTGGPEGWDHVLAIAQGAELVQRWRKPVVSDEPIGAGPRQEPGRRDSDPARFRAAGLLTRLAGLGGTFHYERGLQADIPTGRELQCFDAWNEAWTRLPEDIERTGTFRPAGQPQSVVRSFARESALAVFERQRAADAWVLVIRPRGEPSLQWAAGWTQFSIEKLDGAWLIKATR